MAGKDSTYKDFPPMLLEFFYSWLKTCTEKKILNIKYRGFQPVVLDIFMYG